MTNKIIGMALLGLSTLTMGVAQTATPAAKSDQDPCLLGKRYVGVSFNVVDYTTAHANNGQSGAVFVDVPVNEHIVLEGGYSLFHLHAGGAGATWHSPFAGVTAYTTIKGFKPFVDTGLEYTMKNQHGPFGFTDHYQYWGYAVGAGVEIPVTEKMSVALRTGVSDALVENSQLYWSESAHAIYWFSPRVAGVGGVGITESNADLETIKTVIYSAGIRLVF